MVDIHVAERGALIPIGVSPGVMEPNENKAEALMLLVLAAAAWNPAPVGKVYSALQRAADVAKRRLGVSIDWRLIASQHLHVDGEMARVRDKLRLAGEVGRRLPLLYEIKQIVDEALRYCIDED